MGHQDPGGKEIVPQGGQEEVQGRLGVADGPQGGGKVVIGEGKEHAHQNDPQIGGGVRHQLIRGGNEPEQLGQEQLGQGDGHQGGAANEHAGDKQLPAQAGKVALPEEPGHQHGCAHAGSGNDIDEQVHHALGHTKSRKGVAADVVAHDEGVDDVVQLLEHIGRQQRQTQPDELAGDGAGGEMDLFGHGRTSRGRGGGGFLFIIPPGAKFVNRCFHSLPETVEKIRCPSRGDRIQGNVTGDMPYNRKRPG